MEWLLASVLVPLLKSYLTKLATQAFADYVVREVAHAVVASTETKQDDKVLAHIEAFLDNAPPAP